MGRRKAQPPPTERRFRSVWTELSYLCKKIHYWWYVRTERSKARRYLRRLSALIRAVPKQPRIAIVRVEALALHHESRGEYGLAVKYRRLEIRLTKRLHRIAEKFPDSTRAYALTGRGEGDLKERVAILASLAGKVKPRIR